MAEGRKPRAAGKRSGAYVKKKAWKREEHDRLGMAVWNGEVKMKWGWKTRASRLANCKKQRGWSGSITEVRTTTWQRVAGKSGLIYLQVEEMMRGRCVDWAGRCVDCRQVWVLSRVSSQETGKTGTQTTSTTFTEHLENDVVDPKCFTKRKTTQKT